MTEQLKQALGLPCGDQQANRMNYRRLIWKRRKMLAWIVTVTVLATAVVSLFMTNIYQAKAVIMPVTSRDIGDSGAGLTALAQQFGGLQGIAGSTSASEILNLLKSNILRKKIIQQYDLMPVLFYKQWDAGQRSWKKGGVNLNPAYYLSLFTKAITPNPSQSAAKNVPDTWDALRLLDDIIKIRQDARQNTIIITVDFHDPDMAAKLIEYSLITLTNHMSSEAKRVAMTNRKYMEEQLGSTTDPFIKQKTYNMIAQQIEAGMMAEVKENFAFKIIDPPLPPDKIIKPKRLQMVILALFGALFLGILAALFSEYIKKTKAHK